MARHGGEVPAEDSRWAHEPWSLGSTNSNSADNRLAPLRVPLYKGAFTVEEDAHIRRKIWERAAHGLYGWANSITEGYPVLSFVSTGGYLVTGRRSSEQVARRWTMLAKDGASAAAAAEPPPADPAAADPAAADLAADPAADPAAAQPVPPCELTLAPHKRALPQDQQGQFAQRPKTSKGDQRPLQQLQPPPQAPAQPWDAARADAARRRRGPTTIKCKRCDKKAIKGNYRFCEEHRSAVPSKPRVFAHAQAQQELFLSEKDEYTGDVLAGAAYEGAPHEPQGSLRPVKTLTEAELLEARLAEAVANHEVVELLPDDLFLGTESASMFCI
jgi:hypothetical protein